MTPGQPVRVLAETPVPQGVAAAPASSVRASVGGIAGRPIARQRRRPPTARVSSSVTDVRDLISMRPPGPWQSGGPAYSLLNLKMDYLTL